MTLATLTCMCKDEKKRRGVGMHEKTVKHVVVDGSVTLVSRWVGFPAMFLRIREVSLSR